MKKNDPQLGEITFDSEIGWWEGKVLFPSGSSFEILVNTPSETDHSITDAVRSTFEKIKQSEQFARQFSAEQLLETHNAEWNEGEKITLEEFKKRLIPSCVELWPDGDAEISFDADDLFWGHEIGVRYRRSKFTEVVVQ